MPLTDAQARSARLQGEPYKLPREMGLFVLANPNGATHWRLAYTFRGREKLLSLWWIPCREPCNGAQAPR